MSGSPNYNNLNGQEMPNNVLNPSSPETTVIFNPYQFQPPSITNFTINFRNPGSYHCMVDMNPCPHAVARDSEALFQAAMPNNQRTQTRVRFSSPTSSNQTVCDPSTSGSGSDGSAFHPQQFVGGVLSEPVRSPYEPSSITNGNGVGFAGVRSPSGPPVTTTVFLSRTLPTNPSSPHFQSTPLATVNQNQRNRNSC